MASITIAVSGIDGFQVSRTFMTDDANVPAIVAAYIADPGIPSARDETGAERPRDPAWAVSVWMAEAIQRAAEKAEQHQRSVAAAAAASAVPPIVVTQAS